MILLQNSFWVDGGEKHNYDNLPMKLGTSKDRSGFGAGVGFGGGLTVVVFGGIVVLDVDEVVVEEVVVEVVVVEEVVVVILGFAVEEEFGESNSFVGFVSTSGPNG